MNLKETESKMKFEEKVDLKFEEEKKSQVDYKVDLILKNLG